MRKRSERKLSWIKRCFSCCSKRIRELHNIIKDTDESEHGEIWLAILRRVWRYQRGNQNPYIEDEQTTQWPKEKVQKDKQRYTKHTYKTKDRVTRNPPQTGGERRCSGRVSSSCSTSDTRRVNLVTNPVISHERGKDRDVFTTSGTYPWSFMTHIFHNNGQPSHGGDRKAKPSPFSDVPIPQQT
jgi:hypothetical protein